MHKLSGLVFCVASLAIFAVVSWLIYPYAAQSSDEFQYTSTAQGSEMFEDVDLGDFGVVPVFEMMQHYIESPPIDSGDKKVRFQGC